MKASELERAGYYWCTHDLGMWLAAGEQYPEQWHVVEFSGGWLALAGADISVKADEVPDYVTFSGPLTPPGRHDAQ